MTKCGNCGGLLERAQRVAIRKCPFCGAEQAPPPGSAAGGAEFETLAQEPEPGLLKEFGWFLIENKAWWMVPILVVLGLLTALAWLMSTGAAPFIYPVF